MSYLRKMFLSLVIAVVVSVAVGEFVQQIKHDNMATQMIPGGPIKYVPGYDPTRWADLKPGQSVNINTMSVACADKDTLENYLAIEWIVNGQDASDENYGTAHAKEFQFDVLTCMNTADMVSPFIPIKIIAVDRTFQNGLYDLQLPNGKTGWVDARSVDEE